MVQKIDFNEKFGCLREELLIALQERDVRRQKRLIKEFIERSDAWEILETMNIHSHKDLQKLTDKLRQYYQEPPKSTIDVGTISLTIKPREEQEEPEQVDDERPKLRIEQKPV